MIPLGRAGTLDMLPSPEVADVENTTHLIKPRHTQSGTVSASGTDAFLDLKLTFI
jgi:hypothetical protein